MKKFISKEHILVLSLILMAVAAIEAQFVVGKLHTPPGHLYLGTVHYPPDYFYYLSQMIQGRENFLRSTMLYTTEKLEPVFVGWQTVISGKIFLALGLDVIYAYQAAVVVYLLFFLILSYFIFKELFPESATKRLLAFFFFLFSTALFYLEKTPSGWEIRYFTYWYNLGNALARFGPTPHHLLANTIASLGILVTISHLRNLRNVKKRMVALFLFVGFTLASITPVHWGLIVGASGLTVISIFTLRVLPLRRFAPQGKSASRHPFLGFSMKFILVLLVPFYLLLISGIPTALYAKRVFSTVPYSYSQLWEATQQVHVNWLWLIKGSGLIILLGLLGLIPFCKRLNTGKIFGLSFLLACTLFYFTPIAEKLHMTNARFWPSTVYIFIAALSSEGIFYLASFAKKRRTIVLTGLLVLFTATLVPTFYSQYKEIFTPQTGNSYYYLAQDAFAIFKAAEKVTDRNTPIIVQWPFNQTFPSLTGRKSFFGFYLFTIDSAAKEQRVFEFFDGRMSEETARKFLATYAISYIVGYPWTPKIHSYPFIETVKENGLLGLYRVKK